MTLFTVGGPPKLLLICYCVTPGSVESFWFLPSPVGSNYVRVVWQCNPVFSKNTEVEKAAATFRL